jgi:hypothetical protein
MSIRRACLAIAVGLVLADLAAAAETEIAVVKDAQGQPAAVEAVGLAPEHLKRLAALPPDQEGPSKILALYLVTEKGIQPPAMAGKYEVVGQALRFTPRFALRPGSTYRAHFFPPPPPGPQASPALIKREISIPALPPREPTKVTAVYPSGDVLPENQLRFYLHFSAPVRQGEVYSRVKLLGPDGKHDQRAFLEIGEELWDTTGTRLTLLFDPGRQKRGLLPREEFGPVLVSGKKYTLVIDKNWPDADGRPLAADFKKQFTAGAMIEERLDAKTWKVAAPKAGTRDPLVLRFPHALDRALLEWTIDVKNAAGKAIGGEVTVADQERRWDLVPDAAWQAGEYTLVIDTRLEDSAGNNLARPFEVDVFDKVDRTAEPEHVRLSVRIEK